MGEMTNTEIARYLEEIAFWLELGGENPFRARAYSTAARSIRGYGERLADHVERGDELPKILGVGKDLAAKIAEIINKGEPRLLVKLRQKFPASLSDLVDVPGFGPKRILAAYEALGIHTRRQLKEAAENGRLSQLPGVGPATVKKVADYLNRQLNRPGIVYAVALDEAEAFLALLHLKLNAPNAGIAGELRRGSATVSELVFVVETSLSAEEASALLENLPMVEAVFAQGDRVNGRLVNQLPFRIALAPQGSYGAVTLHETALPAYWNALAGRAIEYGYHLENHGLFEGERLAVAEDEAQIYAALELSPVPPELQESGEYAVREPPQLVSRTDLRGDLHSHTTETDGKNSLEQMAEAARAEGLEYLAISDHSRRLAFINGLDSSRLRTQMERIDRLNQTLVGIRLLKGIEVDILENGELDLPDEVLRETEIVIASVHGWFDLPEAKQTE